MPPSEVAAPSPLGGSSRITYLVRDSIVITSDFLRLGLWLTSRQLNQQSPLDRIFILGNSLRQQITPVAYL